MAENFNKKKCLIFGGTGMLGHKLVQTLAPDLEVWTTIRGPFSKVARFGMFDRTRTIDNLDVLDEQRLFSTIQTIRPDIVINAVGVIKQVSANLEPGEMMAINAEFPHRLASISRAFNFRLICISTDCVFSGDSGNYREDDLADATDLYGRSKHLGEVIGENGLTIRTSMIGRELDSCNSLVEWFLSHRGGEVRGFVNAIFSGLSTVHLADIMADIINHYPSLSGLYHLSGEPITKFDLLRMLDLEFDSGIEIISDDSLAIDRSLNSDRFWRRTELRRPTWPEMIRKLAKDPTPYEKFHVDA